MLFSEGFDPALPSLRQNHDPGHRHADHDPCLWIRRIGLDKSQRRLRHDAISPGEERERERGVLEGFKREEKFGVVRKVLTFFS